MKISSFVITRALIIFTLIAGVVLGKVRVFSPEKLDPLVTNFVNINENLSVNDLSEGLKNYLVNKGYTFTQVKISETAEYSALTVLPGVMGEVDISGNEQLSSEGILNKLGWKKGEPFNYSSFFSKSSSLNRYNFIQVDSKLKPTRGTDGKIVVNANFEVEDQFPAISTISFSNDGTEQSSGWRSRIGVEFWEVLKPQDTLNFSYTLDPTDSSQLSSYFSSYQLKSDDFIHSFYAGFSDSDYDNVVSPSLNMDIAGDGFFAGYSLLHLLAGAADDSLALSFGLSYLDLNTKIFVGTPSIFAGEEELSLLLPQIGIQGKLPQVLGMEGDSLWSLGVQTDLGGSGNFEKGFWIPKASLVIAEPFESLAGGLKLKLDGQLSSGNLPVSLKKSLGGLSTIRGYQEREAYGDSGVSLNFEYSMLSENLSLLNADINYQNVFFYDYGHLSNRGKLTSASDSVDLQSIGAGMNGSIENSVDFSLLVGVPLTETLDTNSNDARIHFKLNYTF